MKTIKLILALWIGLFYPFFIFALESQEIEGVEYNQNTYSIDYKGVKAGKLELNSWIDPKNKTYRLTAKVKPTFLARVLGVTEMLGTSFGDIVDGVFVLDANEWISIKNKKLLTINIENNQVKMSQNGKLKQYAIDDGAKEPLTMIASLAWSLKQNKLPKKAHLIVKKKQQSYLVTKQNNYQLKLTETPNGKRVIMLTYDKNYQLKSLVKTKKGKIDFHVW